MLVDPVWPGGLEHIGKNNWKRLEMRKAKAVVDAERQNKFNPIFSRQRWNSRITSETIRERSKSVKFPFSIDHGFCFPHL